MTNQEQLRTQDQSPGLSSALVPDDVIRENARMIIAGEMSLLERWLYDTAVFVHKNFCVLFIEHGMINNPAAVWLWKHGVQVVVEE